MKNKQEQQEYLPGEAISSWSYNRHKNFNSKRVFFQQYFQKHEFLSSRALDLGAYCDSLLFNGVSSNDKEQAVIDDFGCFKKQGGFKEVGGKVKIEYTEKINGMDVRLNGEVDRILHKDGKWVVLDFKSGVEQPPKANLLEQLTYYLMILRKQEKELLTDKGGNFVAYGFYIHTYPSTYEEDSISGKTTVLPFAISPAEVDALYKEVQRRHKEACAFEKEFLKNGCRSDDPVLAEFAWLDYQIRFLKEEMEYMQPEVLKNIKKKIYFNEEFGSFSVRKGKRTNWTDEEKHKEYLKEMRGHKEKMIEKYRQYLQDEITESVNYKPREEEEYVDRRPIERPAEEVRLEDIPF